MWDVASGNHLGWVNNVSHVDGFSDMVPTGSVREGLIKRTMAALFLWEKAAPTPAPTLMSDNSVPACVSSAQPFKLLPQRWSSEGVSPRKAMSGPFKRNCLGLHKPSVFLSHNPGWLL